MEIKYLGTATGKESTRFDPSEFWLSFKYLYCGNGYYFFDSIKRYEELKEESDFHDLDFELEIKKGKMYIYSYGVPLKRLEYYKGRKTVWGEYYNRAVFSREEKKRTYQEGLTPSGTTMNKDSRRSLSTRINEAS